MNWFRKGPDGKFVWPGFGENMRVLRWMLGRIDGQAQGVDQVFGVSPSYQDIDWTGLEFTPDKFEQIMSVDEGRLARRAGPARRAVRPAGAAPARRPAGHQGQDRGAAGGLIQAAGVCFTSRLRSVRGPRAGSRTLFNVRER